MASEAVKVITSANFEEEVLKAESPALVDFWAPWCGPCRMVSPLIDELAEEFSGRATVGKVNVDTEGALAIRYGVMSIPTVILFKNVEVVEQVTGAYPKEHYEEMLNKAL